MIFTLILCPFLFILIATIALGFDYMLNGPLEPHNSPQAEK